MHYSAPASKADCIGIAQPFHCRHGGCDRRFKRRNLLRNHIAREHGLFVAWGDSGRPPRIKGFQRQQNHDKMNAKVMGDVDKRMRKIHGVQTGFWVQKAAMAWGRIEASATGRQPLKKPLLASFIQRQKSEVLGIVDWGVGQVDMRKWAMLDSNDIILKKATTSKDNKFVDVCKAFSEIGTPQERQVLKDDLLAYHLDQEVFHWLVF